MIMLALLLHAAMLDSPDKTGLAASENIPPNLDKSARADLTQMPIEDAVMLMFQLISKDAREDMRSMLSDMDKLRQKRSAMRDAENEMAKEMQRLRALSRSETDAQPNPILLSQIDWANQLPSLCGELTGAERERCLERQVRAQTAQLRKLPSPR